MGMKKVELKWPETPSAQNGLCYGKSTHAAFGCRRAAVEARGFPDGQYWSDCLHDRLPSKRRFFSDFANVVAWGFAVLVKIHAENELATIGGSLKGGTFRTTGRVTKVAIEVLPKGIGASVVLPSRRIGTGNDKPSETVMFGLDICHPPHGSLSTRRLDAVNAAKDQNGRPIMWGWPVK